MITYERVTYRGQDGKTRTVVLQNARELTLPVLGDILSGLAVDRYGTPVEADPGRCEREGTVTQRQHMIERSLISRRVELVDDLRFGEGLVPAPPQGETDRDAS